MREIKFRGIPIKSAKEGVFIEGDLIQTTEGRYFIFPEGFDLELTNLVEGVSAYSGFGLLAEVYPETIGQFTGLKDMRDKEIYEGDIVKVHHIDGDLTGIVKFTQGMFYIDCLPQEDHLLSNCVITFDTIDTRDIEVIGNIYKKTDLVEKNHEGNKKAT